MRITVPDEAWGHFWEEPPAGAVEFWAFRFKPRCQVGAPMLFVYHGVIVARATVGGIEPPGQSWCDRTGRFKNRWKVYWHPHTFRDLRPGARRAEG